MARMKALSGFDFKGKTVLLRVDINSPINSEKRIVNENRIRESVPTLKKLLDAGARLAIIAHQGDTLDYQNLIPMKEHAEKLSAHLGRPIAYIDDVCGPAAQEKVKALRPGEAILLGNLRYLSEEISTFENAVKLRPEQMLNTYLVQRTRAACRLLRERRIRCGTPECSFHGRIPGTEADGRRRPPFQGSRST